MPLDPSTCSDAEWAFHVTWRQLVPDIELEAEYRFDPGRKWRFDFAHPGSRVAVEIEGGSRGSAVRCQSCGAIVRARRADGSPGAEIRVGGRHTSGAGFAADIEKYNAAAAAGWLVFRFTPQQIADDPATRLADVSRSIRSRSSSA